MKTISLGVIGATLSGCSNLTPSATATQSRGLVLEAGSSARVQVAGSHLQINHGALEFAGVISRRPGASSTSFFYFDALFRNVWGQVLLVKPVTFIAQTVGYSRFRGKRGFNLLNLEEWPEGTVRTLRPRIAGKALSPRRTRFNP